MSKTPVSTLQEYAVKNMWGVPDYTLISSSSGSAPPNFTYRVTCRSESACGTASSKKDAKHAAAKELLKQLDRNGMTNDKVDSPPQPSRELVQKIGSYYLSSSAINHEDVFVNSVGKLGEYCLENKLKLPDYRDAGAHGPPHKPVYTIICCIGQLEIKASANTKKKAKHDAAQQMLDKLVRNSGKSRSQLTSEQLQETEKLLHDLDFLDLKVDDRPIPSRQSAQRANTLFTKLQTYNGIKRDISKINLSDRHMVFKASYEPLVREIAIASLRENPYKSASKHETLKNVTSLLGLEIEYHVLSNTPDPIIVICRLNSSPVIVDMGIADTYLDARDQAISNALDSINTLLT